MRRATMLCFVGLWLFSAVPARSHHAEPLYDMKHPITVTGSVGRVEWSNPHVYLYVNVLADKGGTEEWSIELDSPHSLQHNGWTPKTVKAGDRIACTGGRAKSGARALRSASVELPDGRKLKS